MTDSSSAPEDKIAQYFRAVICSETPAQVFDFHSRDVIDEILRSESAIVPPEFPLLADHGRKIADIMGKALNAQQIGAQWEALLKLNRSRSGVEAAAKIIDGDLRGVSIGYQLLRWEMVPVNGEMRIEGRLYRAGPDRPLRVVTSFRVIEVSLVVFPADPNAQIKRCDYGRPRFVPQTAGPVVGSTAPRLQPQPRARHFR